MLFLPLFVALRSLNERRLARGELFPPNMLGLHRHRLIFRDRNDHFSCRLWRCRSHSTLPHHAAPKRRLHAETNTSTSHTRRCGRFWTACGGRFPLSWLMVDTFLVYKGARHLLRGHEGSHGTIGDHLRDYFPPWVRVGEMLG